MAVTKESDVFGQDKNRLFEKNKDGEIVARLFQKDKGAPIIADKDRLTAMKKHSEENGIEPDISAAALATLERIRTEQTRGDRKLSKAFSPVAAKSAPSADTVKLSDLKNPEVARQIRSQGRLAKLGVATH